MEERDYLPLFVEQIILGVVVYIKTQVKQFCSGHDII